MTLWNPGTDSGSASWGLGQMFVEGKGFDFARNQVLGRQALLRPRRRPHQRQVQVQTASARAYGIGLGR
jgi:hypothetical protein